MTDTERSLIIESEGYRVLRFWNNDVLSNPAGVWTMIDAALRGHHPTPTPRHRGVGLS
jgi:BirA family biotin operon repressor/biotin-[acetyl-CoA-carboxylase] ligase